MKKVTLVLANANLEYLKFLAEYIRSTDFAEKFIVKCFSQRNALEQFIAEMQGLDILLTQRELLPDDDCLKKINTLLLFRETATGLDTGYTFIESYQPLNLLFNQVLNCFHEKNGYVSGLGGNREKTTVISLYSSTGNSGKTTVALNLCQQIAGLGHTVFYLNLESISSQPLFFESPDNEGFSQILYYLKKGNEQQINLKIQSLKRYSAVYKIDYLDPATNIAEMMEMNGRDVSLFIESLVKTGTYDYLIIDLESGLNERILAALQQSDCILWLLLDDIQYLFKTKVMLNYLNNTMREKCPGIEEKTRYIISKFTGTFANSVHELNQQPFARLPYIPEWKSVTYGEMLFNMNVYNEHILKLFYDLFEGRR